MLKSLFPHIDWDIIKVVGFDLDGTLYDETEFIAQVYRPISELIGTACCTSSSQIHSAMLRRWIEMGSSYNNIFSEILTSHDIYGTAANHIIAECLALFRNFRPALTLPARVSSLLELMNESFDFFLASDGSVQLQMNKFRALGLECWFNPDNVAISGRNGPGFEKPSVKMLREIAVLQTGLDPRSIVYFGDREIDRMFAEAAGFQSVTVSCLIPKQL